VPARKVSQIWGSAEINLWQKVPPSSFRSFMLSSEIPKPRDKLVAERPTKKLQILRAFFRDPQALGFKVGERSNWGGGSPRTCSASDMAP